MPRLQPVYDLNFLETKNPQEIPEKGTFEGSDVAGVRIEIQTEREARSGHPFLTTTQKDGWLRSARLILCHLIADVIIFVYKLFTIFEAS